MSTLYSVSLGDTVLAEDQNQVIRALSNQFGLLADDQVRLGRLALPVVTATPTTPVAGMAWWRSDLGSNGRLHLYDGAGQVVPYMPLRQVQKSAELGGVVTITSTTPADVTGLSISITTTGGRLRIMLVPGTAGGQITLSCSGAISNPFSTLYADIGGVSIPQDFRFIGDAASAAWTIGIPPSAFVWDYQPAAGTYTVKIQAAVNGANMEVAARTGIALLVEEWGD